MPTKKEMLEAKTKDTLLKIAKKAKVTAVKKSMRKCDLVDVLGNSRKIKKADL